MEKIKSVKTTLTNQLALLIIVLNSYISYSCNSCNILCNLTVIEFVLIFFLPSHAPHPIPTTENRSICSTKKPCCFLCHCCQQWISLLPERSHLLSEILLYFIHYFQAVINTKHFPLWYCFKGNRLVMSGYLDSEEKRSHLENAWAGRGNFPGGIAIQ